MESTRTNRITSELGTLVGLQQDAATEHHVQGRLKEQRLSIEHFRGGISKMMRSCGVDIEDDLLDICGGAS